MKKFVKPAIIAASVAAIAGIGAVSFAAWSGSSASKDVTGTTGSVNTSGEITITNNSIDGKTLMPYDQGSGDRLWSFDVSVASTGAAPVVQLTGKLEAATPTDATHTAIGEAKLYVYNGTTWNTAPTSGELGGDWVELDATAAKTIKMYETDGTASTDGSGTVYVVLSATGTDAMGATATLTVSAQAAS